MGVGEDFSVFCGAIGVKNGESRSLRYQRITRRLNLEFWQSDSETSHSFYLGSYGRGTATGITSDVDMLFQLPATMYEKYAAYSGNGQSALLQAVRSAMMKTYASSDVGADGQVVSVRFDDGLTFEVLPAFRNTDASYTFADSNGGGDWRTTNPKPEIEAFDARDAACNYNLKMLGRMMRSWKAEWSVPISGLLIDTLAYNFIGSWSERDKSYLYYDWMSRDFFQFLYNQSESQQYWLSPGANQYVWRTGKFEYKAKQCYNVAVAAINHATANEHWSAGQRWREIYGTKYPP